MRLTTTGRSTDAELLAQIPLTESERREAERYLELGGRMADLILRVSTAVSSALHRVERGLRAITGARPAS
jgi:hypothetical protein